MRIVTKAPVALLVALWYISSVLVPRVARDRAMPNEVLYTVDEVATRLSVHPETVRNWIKNGELAAVNLGGSAGYRISESDLAGFLRKRRGAPKQDS